MSKLYFIRHAQAAFLADNYDQLSSKGEQQSFELGKYLVNKKVRFNQIFVGPLQRQKHTFEIVKEVFIKNKIDIPTPVFINELKEHGGTEAMRKALPQLLKHSKVQALMSAAQENPKLKKRNTLLVFQQFMNEWSQGKIEVEGIEPWDLFRKNVKNGLDYILKNTNKGETIGVFTSGGTISSITAEALQIQNEERVAAMNFSIRNTSYSTFLYSKNQFNLLSFNELPHLNEDLITFV